MADPVTTDLNALETDVALLFKPLTDPPELIDNASLVLTLIKALYGPVPSIATVGRGISSGFTEVSTVLTTILDPLQQVAAAGASATDIVTTLQNALAMAQVSAPGGAASGALNSGSQFFETIKKFLSGPENITSKIETLKKLAKQFQALGTAIQPPSTP